MVTALALALHAPAHAVPPSIRSGRLALGVTGATGIVPVEPTWVRPRAGPAAVGCAALTGWWIYGGHDYAGKDGQVLRATDGWRLGADASVCPTSGGGTQGGVGGGFGRQWGTNLFVTTHVTAGLSAFRKAGPGGEAYTAVAPYAKPTVALGLALVPGMTFEVGPYVWLAPPVFQSATPNVPAGMFFGHFGLQATVLVGNASPRAFN